MTRRHQRWSVAKLPRLSHRRRDDSATCTSPAGNPNGIERRLRQDPRVDRLLGNKNWQGAAEAAIGHFVHGRPCSIDSWRRSSTWSQVGAVYEELTEHQKLGA